MREDGFERVASIDELEDELPVAAQLSDGNGICLVKIQGGVYAFQNRCTHAEFPLSDGEIVDDFVIECGLHGAQFDVRTGKVLELPATEDLPCFETKVDDEGGVWVRRTTSSTS